MIEKILTKLARSQFCRRINFDKLLTDIPNSFFIDNYNVKRKEFNGAILISSCLFAMIIASLVTIYDVIFGFLVLIIICLTSILFMVRRIRKLYLKEILEVEQYSDLICREIMLILSTTNSLPMVIEFLSKGSYPIISPMMDQLIKKMNMGSSPVNLLEDFAKNQPSETIKEFIFEIVIPYAKGQLKQGNTINYEAQWRIRNNFDSYVNQLEGKISIFLAITTIIPVTISMLLVMLGYININLIIFLPLVFFVFDLIAIEIFNSGKVELLGGL
ncbi:MAG: hypothetical protein HZR80_02000 [Candidatus Heimdallarchaeota archaeon]